MTFDNYQHLASKTAQYDNWEKQFRERYASLLDSNKEFAEDIDRIFKIISLSYLVLGITSEAGEIAGKLKKTIRDDSGQLKAEKIGALAAETGDTMWYQAGICRELNIPMGVVAQDNITKLYDRLERNKIQGSGDNR